MFICIDENKRVGSVYSYSLEEMKERFTEEFIDTCMETQEVVELDSLYNSETNTFTAPVKPQEPVEDNPLSLTEAMMPILIDQEYRLVLIEMGVN